MCCRGRFRRDMLIGELQKLATYAVGEAGKLAEIEINPLFVMAEQAIAVDALIRVVDT